MILVLNLAADQSNGKSRISSASAQAFCEMYITVGIPGAHLTFGNKLHYSVCLVPNASCISCFAGEKLTQEGWGLPLANFRTSLVLTALS